MKQLQSEAFILQARHQNKTARFCLRQPLKKGATV